MKHAAVNKLLLCLLGGLSAAIGCCRVVFADDDGAAREEFGNGHRFISGSFQQPGGTPIIHRVCNESGEKSAFVWPAAGFGVDATARLRPGLCAQKRIYNYTVHSWVRDEVKFENSGVAHPETLFACDSYALGIDACEFVRPELISFLSSYLTFMLSNPDENNITFAESNINLRAEGPAVIALNMDPSPVATSMIVVLNKSTIGIEALAARVEESAPRVEYTVSELGQLLEQGVLNATVLVADLDNSSPSVLYSNIQEHTEYYIETLILSSFADFGERISLVISIDDSATIRHDLFNALQSVQ